ncbi:hypothetical protein EEB12_29500 [Rhodococcus sp. WS1]|uniref:hypothetical protein n=1 Tax=unclassified Rhodococcus (in: high G+C Gram-positive bacteria) TaxID=192944 RepID=UPI001141FF17|nr:MULTISPECIES: hypothetical protein [unclassified Rhodococcus (in: high G+C Gram-positive bacteria)]ROZ52955.1 hypothetical protein EEB12_29500 [Rhodococcus sp. WS1]TQC36045.1 hypothetical protein EEB16_21070 [Rhodococcus sp. WS7]
MTAISGRNRHAFDAEVTAPIRTSSEVPPESSADAPRRASTRMNAARILLVLALIPVGALYLYPRISELTATPYRLDQAVVSAGNYNPALNQIVEHEKITLAAFDALDKMDASLASVLSTDVTVTTELNSLTGRITGDIQKTLDLADANVADLVVSLDTLTTRISSLQAPVDGATTAVAADRATLNAILTDIRVTAEKVHSARLSAEESANDLSGK